MPNNSLNIDKVLSPDEDNFSDFVGALTKLEADPTPRLDNASWLCGFYDFLRPKSGKSMVDRKKLGSKYYVVPRELGLYYTDYADAKLKTCLSDGAKKYINEEITYADYMFHYCLNFHQAINGKLVHVIDEVINNLDSNVANIAKEAKALNVQPESLDSLNRFLQRCRFAKILDKDNTLLLGDNFLQEKILEHKLDIPAKTFEKKYKGTRKAHQKLVEEFYSNVEAVPEVNSDAPKSYDLWNHVLQEGKILGAGSNRAALGSIALSTLNSMSLFSQDDCAIYLEKNIGRTSQKVFVDGMHIEYDNPGTATLEVLSICGFSARSRKPTKRKTDAKKTILASQKNLTSFFQEVFKFQTSIDSYSDVAVEDKMRELQDARKDLTKVKISIVYWGNLTLKEKKSLESTIELDLYSTKKRKRPVSLSFVVEDYEGLEKAGGEEGRTYKDEVISFKDFHKVKSFEALKVVEKSEEYDAYLTALPARLLANMYKEYGLQLLELNVRAHLGVRSKVNKGMTETISHIPDRFFVYNNGLCMTAEEVLHSSKKEFGITQIRGVRGCQIVNGGQTVATLEHALKSGENIDDIWLQVKITEVLKNHKKLVADISRYSNSQNSVNAVNLGANHYYHKQAEKHFKQFACPDETFYYYERHQGGYAVEIGQKPGKENAFPPDKVVRLDDVARWENCYIGAPHLVASGGQKNFVQFMRHHLPYKKNQKEDYYKQLVSKGIVHRALDAELDKVEVSGSAYRHLTKPYTISLIWQCFGSAINLETVWEKQGVERWVILCAREIAALVKKKHDKDALKLEQNRGEWPKKEQCWIGWPEENIKGFSKLITPRLKKQILTSAGISKVKAKQLLNASEPDYKCYKKTRTVECPTCFISDYQTRILKAKSLKQLTCRGCGHKWSIPTE